jgi:hypothetical protein
MSKLCDRQRTPKEISEYRDRPGEYLVVTTLYPIALRHDVDVVPS